jgi:hypothetical protein
MSLLRNDTQFSSGWINANETWVYASADDPTFTFTISGDKTSKYSAGMKVKLTQTTVKYFIITKVAYSDPNTTITVYGGTDYDLANAAITLPYFSLVKAPHGFPLDPMKWTVEVTDTTNREQVSPVQNTWYHLGSVLITVPIGIWHLSICCMPEAWGASGDITASSSLSTSNNSESNSKLTSQTRTYSADSSAAKMFSSDIVSLESKTVYYMIVRTVSNTVSSLNIRSDRTTSILKAVCAYL